MTSKEVLAMLDAIIEGRNWHHAFDGKTGGHELSITNDGFQIRAEGDGTIDSSPSNARNIAGALVAWANQQEGLNSTSTEMAAAMRLFGWTEMSSDRNPINTSRTDWYISSVKLMTLETMVRNFDDLKKIEKLLAPTSDELADVRRAMDVIWVALHEKNPNIKQCQRCQLVDGPLHDKFCREK